MASIYQSIEILSKEKGIDPQIVLDAVKDAMLVAARKHFRTTEDLVADMDKSGAIQIYGVRRVVEQVQDPGKEISLNDARKIDPAAELDREKTRLLIDEITGLQCQLIVTSLDPDRPEFGPPERAFHVEQGRVITL